jgi:hypothetical protein
MVLLRPLPLDTANHFKIWTDLAKNQMRLVRSAKQQIPKIEAELRQSVEETHNRRKKRKRFDNVDLADPPKRLRRSRRIAVQVISSLK